MAKKAKATVAGGCFWCTEAAFDELDGVYDALPGYAGGEEDNPSYMEVAHGQTGHAECVQIHYDPEQLSYEDILEVFFKIHNPTTKDRQGPDVGPQYRSAVFYHNNEQRNAVEQAINRLESEGVYNGIVTEVAELDAFYEAEDYHHDYFKKNPDAAYCKAHVAPKVKKVHDVFADLV